jgi:hypothetical protein
MRRKGDLWTRAEDEALRELAKIGITMVEAARRLGRDPSTVQKHSRGLTWVRPQKADKPVRELATSARPWTTDEDELLIELSTQGVPINRAAMHLDRNYFTVWRHSRKLGLTWRRDTEARARNLYCRPSGEGSSAGIGGSMQP